MSKLTRIHPLASALIYLCIGVFALMALLPFVLIVTGSLTDEEEILTEGFKVFPRTVSDRAWQMLLSDFTRVANGYLITSMVTVFGTLLALVITAMAAYPISLPYVKYRNILAFFGFFTMIFYGGIVPWFIVVRKILHLQNSILALILPYTINAWNMFLLRNFFRTIPVEISESAKIDGAGEFSIFFRLIVPLAKPGLATIALFIALGYWNDWWLGLMLIEKYKLFPLQLMLRAIVSNIEFLRSAAAASVSGEVHGILPYEGVKMATGLVTIGPIILLYPFVQKYFVKGIVVGALKG